MLLQASGITKMYGSNVILSNIHLRINERERIGLVGANGAGKSTLLRILAGESSYDGGQLFRAKGVTVGYLAQDSGLVSDLSIESEMRSVFADLLAMEQELRELETRMADPGLTERSAEYNQVLSRYDALSETYRERGGYAVEATIRGVLHGMGFGAIPPETIVSTLSGGQKTRLALAKLLLQKPDVLLLDEPTNHLDIDTLTWLEQYLRGYSGAILVVSHDRYFLDALVDSICEIERTSSRRYTGNYTKYMEQKAADYERELKLYEKQQAEIARMEDFIRRNIARASTTKRAQSRRNMLERMERLDRPGERKRASFRFETERVSGNDVLKVEGLSMSYDEGLTPLFRNVEFELRRGESVALIGPNGIGKSTLLKALVGEKSPDSGVIRWGTNVTIGYYDQEQTGLNPELTVLEQLWSEYPHLEEVRIRTVLGNFLFSGEDVEKKIRNLSGGEKARVSLAKLMLKKANVLILDEPTNHLDLMSKEVLESALLDYEGTLLFISHDRYFLNRMAERVIELHPDGVRHFLGNYDDVVAKRLELAELSAPDAAESLFGGARRGFAPFGDASPNAGSAAGPAAQTAAGRGASASAVTAFDAPSASDSTANSTSSNPKAANPTASDASSPGLSASASGSSPQSPAASGSGSAAYLAEKQARREERMRQRKIEQLETNISEAEEEIAQLEERMADPEIYQDYTALQQLQAEIDQRKQQLSDWYAEWESLHVE